MATRCVVSFAAGMLLMVSLVSSETVRGKASDNLPDLSVPKLQWCSSFEAYKVSLDQDPLRPSSPLSQIREGQAKGILYRMDSLLERWERGRFDLSQRHKENIVSFMVTIASYLRSDWKSLRSSLLLGSETNPRAPVVLLAMADNLKNAPSWSPGVRNTVMCYLEVVTHKYSEGAEAALASAVNQCEFPQTRRPDMLDYFKQKTKIVNYCGDTPPFREAELANGNLSSVIQQQD